MTLRIIFGHNTTELKKTAIESVHRLVMKIKECITEWWVGQRRNQRNKTIFVTKKKTQQNIVLKGNLQATHIYKKSEHK